MCWYASMSAQRIGTCTVCLTVVTLPYVRRERAVMLSALPGPSRLVAGELAVRGAVRAGGLDAEPLDLVLLVVLEVALEPEPLRLALVGEDVRRHPVEEPAVVADHDGAARELQQRALQAGERLDVEVVGGLVEQQQVAALLEGQGEVEPVPLATGQHASRLLLVGALEPERGDVGPRGHLDVADLDVVEAVGDDVPQRLLRVDAAAVLLDIRQLDRLADLDLAVVGLLLADQHLEQRGLARTVGADDADARQREREVVDQDPVTEALGEALRLDDDAAQARARRDLDLLEVELAELLGLRGHLLVPGQTGLALRLPRLGAGADPLQLVLQALLALGVLGALALEAGGLGLEVGGVVALVGVVPAAVELEDPLGDIVEEVPVVGDGDDGAGVLLEVLLEPGHALGVEVVGGLV